MKRTIHHPTKRELMQSLFWTLFVFFLIFACATLQECRAQSVARNGKMFIQQSNPSNKKDSATLTGYFYIDAKGVKYPIYMSSKSKCFILRTSAKTGKRYKQYLPEVTKQLTK